MSTRYVWDIYDYDLSWVKKNASGLSFISVVISESDITDTSLVWLCGTSGTYFENSNDFAISGTVTYTGTSYVNAKNYPYLKLSPFIKNGTATISGTQVLAPKFILNYLGVSSSYYWRPQIYYSGNGYLEYRVGVATANNSSAPWGSCNAQFSVQENQKTTQTGKIASTSESKYPKDAISNDHWYVYLGSDSIDPIGISYSNTTPSGGQSITVTVQPRSNTYGGTIYYQYQYSINDGATWIDSGSKTTSTTKTFTLQKGPSKFCVRVKASDNYGFTSTDYVTGSKLTVKNNIAPISISYSKKELRGGEDITVTLEPPSGVNWTVYYTYDYSLDNYTWKRDTKTTARSRTYTIPRGSKYFKVRVYATDDYDNTSQYVFGTLLTIINIRAYIGINGKSRKVVKVYIGVNGKAREVKAGYIGINGKSKAWY